MIITYKVEGSNSYRKSFELYLEDFESCDTMDEVEELLNELIQEHFNPTVFPYVPDFEELVRKVYEAKGK